MGLFDGTTKKFAAKLVTEMTKQKEVYYQLAKEASDDPYQKLRCGIIGDTLKEVSAIIIRTTDLNADDFVMETETADVETPPST